MYTHAACHTVYKIEYSTSVLTISDTKLLLGHLHACMRGIHRSVPKRTNNPPIFLFSYKHFLTTLYGNLLFFPHLFSSSVGGKERSLAIYKSRDGGERGSSPAVEDVARDREEGAEALRHHATTEEDTRT
jgi:hypothetical protein